MKNNEMQKHIIEILKKSYLRSDLINDLYIDVDTFVFLPNISEEEMWDYYKWICKELKIKNRVMLSSGINSEDARKMKVDGHLNEELIKNELLFDLDDSSFKKILNEDEKIVDVICDGIRSKKVESILDKKTTSKCDLKVILNSKREIKLSAKKSENGQVHLNKIIPFIKGYEKRYGQISDIVKESLLFLFSGHKSTMEILNDAKYINENENIHKLELRHHTLSIETMNKFNPILSEELLMWFKSNIGNITDTVFKKGWSKNENEWVDYILYRNKINNIESINDIINVDVLIKESIKHSNEIYFGTENGGTTILLPFGSVQYHLGGLQFHHNKKKIMKMIS
jgi:hypothetical protein